MSENKKTCLYDKHVALGALMSPFGGFEMPIQYSGIKETHFHKRHQRCRGRENFLWNDVISQRRYS